MSKSILLKSLFFILIIIAIDQFVGLVLRHYFFRQKSGQSHSLNVVISECKADIIITGASTAQHHYDTRIISSFLKMTSYNAGQDGGHSILFDNALIKMILVRYTPKIIILETKFNRLDYRADDYDKLSILLPYYKSYPNIKSIINLKDPYEEVKLLSAIYPFNSQIINIIRFNIASSSERRVDYNGFIPIKNKVIDDAIINQNTIFKNIEEPVDTNKINALKEIISLCKIKKIKLYIINSPEFHFKKDTIQVQSKSVKQALEIIQKENISYFNFSYDTNFIERKNLFLDKLHLNADGATLFSNILSESIDNSLKKNEK